MELLTLHVRIPSLPYPVPRNPNPDTCRAPRVADDTNEYDYAEVGHLRSGGPGAET